LRIGIRAAMAIVSGSPTSLAAEERVKKIATNLLIVGGTGGIHNTSRGSLEDSRRTSTSEEVAALVCGAAAEDGPSGDLL
jgi:hypothetical protein